MADQPNEPVLFEKGSIDPPAVYVNRVTAALNNQNLVRMSFGESFGEAGPHLYRLSIMMTASDARAVADLILKVILPQSAALVEPPAQQGVTG